MTIDSFYFMESHAVDRLDTMYTFEFESIGAGSLVPWVSYYDENGDFMSRAVNTTEYEVIFGGEPPIYYRGEITITATDLTLPGEDTTLYFLRKTPILQFLDLIPYTPMPTESIEFAADKLTLILQEIDGNKCDCGGGGFNEGIIPPPDPGTPLPECVPYTCDAYETYLEGLGVPWAKAYTTSSTEALPFPFSTDHNVVDGKFIYYFEFIAGARQITSWGSTVEQSTVDSTGMGSPDFCGGTGEITKITSIDGSASYGPDAMVWPTSADNWGDYFIEAIITGYRGSTSVITGVLTRNSGKRWYMVRNGSGYTLNEQIIQISCGSSGNDLTFTVSVNQASGFGYNNVSESMTVLDKNDTYLLVQIEVETSDPRVGPWTTNSTPDSTCVVRDVNITVRCDGQVLNVSTVQCYGYGLTGNLAPITDLQPVGHTTFTAPRSFYTQAQLAIVTWAAGIQDGSNYDPLAGQLAFERNFVEYELPAYCSGGGYVCSSQVDAATDQGIDYSLNLTSDDANWPYPFSTTGSSAALGNPTKFAVFRDYVSGPTILPDWNSTLPEKQTATGWPGYDNLKLLKQCQITNDLTQMVGLETTQSSPVAIIPPSNITTGTAYPSSTSVFTVTGYEGDGQNTGMTLLARQLGCTRKYTSANTQYSDVPMSVVIGGDINSDAVVTVSVGEGAGVDSFVINAGSFAGKWVNVVVTETTTFQLLESAPAAWRDIVTVKVTVTQEDGTTETQTAVGYEEKTFVGDFTYFSFDYASYDEIPNGFYYLPVMFYGGVNRKVSIGHLAYGPGEGDHAALSQAFLRNFTNYTP